jgi:hypothetical protein
MKTKSSIIDAKKIFDTESEHMPRGAWWWWFWLFFFKNPKDPDKPRQLMILWSTKNEREIDCNDVRIEIKPNEDRRNLCGAVAAWYFDGEKMHHNMLLEKCNISISEKGLCTNSKIPTSFSMDDGRSVVRIGDDFEFIAESDNSQDFTKLTCQSSTYMKNKGYFIIRQNRLKLGGRLKGEEIEGSAYFQRVFVHSPLPSWYWAIVHFENGGILTYFRPYVLGKAVKKDISFFDGKEMHFFHDIEVEKSGKETPVFAISGKNEDEKIRFTVKTYSHSSWTFRKRSLKVIPVKLVYNEYPAVVSEFNLTNSKTGKTISLEDLGKSVGNAEHGTGLML